MDSTKSKYVEILLASCLFCFQFGTGESSAMKDMYLEQQKHVSGWLAPEGHREDGRGRGGGPLGE